MVYLSRNYLLTAVFDVVILAFVNAKLGGDHFISG
jgi:hypothetical protein